MDCTKAQVKQLNTAKCSKMGKDEGKAQGKSKQTGAKVGPKVAEG